MGRNENNIGIITDGRGREIVPKGYNYCQHCDTWHSDMRYTFCPTCDLVEELSGYIYDK